MRMLGSQALIFKNFINDNILLMNKSWRRELFTGPIRHCLDMINLVRCVCVLVCTESVLLPLFDSFLVVRKDRKVACVSPCET